MIGVIEQTQNKILEKIAEGREKDLESLYLRGYYDGFLDGKDGKEPNGAGSLFKLKEVLRETFRR